jgi:hypothetical protein
MLVVRVMNGVPREALRPEHVVVHYPDGPIGSVDGAPSVLIAKPDTERGRSFSSWRAKR